MHTTAIVAWTELCQNFVLYLLRLWKGCARIARKNKKIMYIIRVRAVRGKSIDCACSRAAHNNKQDVVFLQRHRNARIRFPPVQ